MTHVSLQSLTHFMSFIFVSFKKWRSNYLFYPVHNNSRYKIQMLQSSMSSRCYWDLTQLRSFGWGNINEVKKKTSKRSSWFYDEFSQWCTEHDVKYLRIWRYTIEDTTSFGLFKAPPMSWLERVAQTDFVFVYVCVPLSIREIDRPCLWQCVQNSCRSLFFFITLLMD